MANARRWDPFQLFYYGQDRYGAWPFLAIRLGGMAFGAAISWENVHTCLTAWLLCGAVVMAGLCRPRALGALVFMVVLLVNPEMGIMFDQQPYGWQLTTILLAWWSFRCLLERIVDARRPVAIAVSLLGAMGFAALSTWTSPMSGLILLFVQLIELIRVRHRFAKHWRYLGLIAGPIAIGIGFELLLRKLYHDFAATHFGHDFRTALIIDWGNINSNARSVWRTVLESEWSIAATAGALIAIAAAGIIKWIIEPRLGRDKIETARELSFVALGCASGALAQIPIIIVVQHFRLNQFDGRFLALARFFGTAAGLLSIAAAASIIISRFTSWSVSARLGSGLGLAVLAATMPVRPVDPQYIVRKRVAAELAARSPGSVLLSGYWDTYELAALEPNSLVPLPFDDEYLRIPWNIAALKDAREVIVGHQGFGDGPKVATPAMEQYGVKIRLLVSDWYVDGPRRYSLYRNEAAPAPLPGRPP
jgi:hypothetical protein